MVNSVENDEVLSKSMNNNGPRVSFNRDVHVKRYGSQLNNDSLNYDTNSRSQSPANLRRELPTDLSEEALEREAAFVLEQVNNFGSLPHRSSSKQQQQYRKPVRRSKSDASSSKKPKRSSILNIFNSAPSTSITNPSSNISSNNNNLNNKKTNERHSSGNDNNSKKVTRSKSDVSSQSSNTNRHDKYRKRIHLNSNLFHNSNLTNSSDSSDNNANSLLIHKKVPLSPITEVNTPLLSEANNRSDYFDNRFLNEKLTSEDKRAGTLKASDLSKRHSKSMEAMHSSQMPIEKPSLTRGMAVDKMVKRLSTERLSPPPAQILQAGAFSYTNPIVKPKSLSPPHQVAMTAGNDSDVVYAQVVCNETLNADGSKTIQSKETVHDTIKRHSASPSPSPSRINKITLNEKFLDDSKNFDFIKTAKSPSPAAAAAAAAVNGNSYPYRNSIKIETDYDRDEVDNSAGEPIIRPVNIRHHIPRHPSNTNINHISSSNNYHNLDSEFDQLNEMRDAADTAFNGGVDASLSSRRKILESRIKSRIDGLHFNNNNDNQYHSNIRKSTSPPPPPTTLKSQQLRYNKYGGSNEIVNRYSPERSHHLNLVHTTASQERHIINKSNNGNNHANGSSNTLPKKTTTLLLAKNEKGDSGIEADTNTFMRNNRRGRHLSSSRFNIGRPWNYEDDIIECELFLMKERKHTEETYPYHLVRTFVHRERSIDDGSHYDPNLDKANIIKEWKHNKKMTREFLKSQKKKKSSIEKVKELFKSNKKPNGISESELRSRYREYSPDLEPPPKYNSTLQQDISNRRRLSTPTASPIVSSRSKSLPPKGINRKSSSTTTTTTTTNTLKRDNNNKENNSQKFNWFASLERLSRRKNKDVSNPSTIDRKSEISRNKSSSMKNISNSTNGSHKTLRFFGDTDADETDAINLRRSHLSQEEKQKSSSLQNLNSHRSKSKSVSRSRAELQNISESTSDTEFIEQPIRRPVSPIINTNLPPVRPPKSSKLVSSVASSTTLPRPPRRKMFVDDPEESSYRPQHESTPFYHHNHRRENLDSDSNFSSARRLRESMSVSRENLHRERFDSDASQRSVVYLHATTVGDIPSQTLGRRMSGKNSIKAALHDENQGTTVRTVNRSYSLSAPWKPKFISDGYEIEYNNDQQKGKYHHQNRMRSKSASRDRDRRLNVS